MRASLVSIQVGVPRQYGDALSSDPFERLWTTGIFKTPISGEVPVGPDGLIGDGQADLTVHGGPDKAICVYSGDHYPEWRQSPHLAAMGPGAFGENFTLEGVTEDEVCIGDVFAVGVLRLELSQPRQPCWKLARKWGLRDFTERVIESGWTGWYLRVRQGGTVAAGATLTLVARPHPEWTVRAANRVMHGRPRDRAAAATLAGVPALSESWRATLSKR